MKNLSVVIIPGGAFLVYLVALALRLPQWYTNFIGWNSDAVSYPLLAATIAHGTPSLYYLPNAPWYSTLLLDVVTYHLPAHVAIWVAWPIATYVAAIAVLGWVVWQIFGHVPAIMVTLLSLSLTPAEALPLMAQAYHSLTTINCILLVAFQVVLLRPRPCTPLLLLAALSFGILTGVNAASDPLLLIIGIIPCALASLLAWWRTRQARALGGLASCAIAVAVMRASAAIAPHLGLLYVSPPFPLAHLGQIPSQITLMGGIVWEELAGMWGVDPPLSAEIITGYTTLLGLLAALTFLAIRLLQRRSPPLEDVYLTLWLAIAGANLAALTCTTVAGDLTQVRYASTLWVAGVALLPVFLRGGSTPLQRVAFAGITTTLLIIHAITWMPPVRQDTPGDLTPLVTYLESQHVSYGYADYWEANATTWQTDGQVILRPANSCHGSGPLCATPANIASIWYAPTTRAAGWTAIVVDPRYGLTIASTAYGPPVRVQRIGRLTVYLYPYPLPPPTIQPMS